MFQKRIRRIILILLATVAIPTAGLFAMSFFSRPPTSLAIQEGRLASCPDSPNCVSSQANDPQHAMDAMKYASDRDTAKQTLVKILQSIPNAVVVKETEDYLHAEFTSRICPAPTPCARVRAQPPRRPAPPSPHGS